MGILKLVARRGQKRIGEASALPEAAYPVPDDLIEDFGQSYEGRDGNALTADIYRPSADAEGRLPVIILIHGGGLMVGHPIMERGACEAMARKGYLVIAPSYRMMTEAEASGEIDDICASFDLALSILESYSGDADRIFVIAESAGAFLALNAIAAAGSEKLRSLIGCTPSAAEIRAVAFVSGMFYTARRDALGLIYPRDIFGARRKDREFMSYMDPENPEVMSKLPPAILTSSRNDFLRKYTLRYAEALKRFGKDSKLIYYPEKNKQLIHAFVTLWPDLPESREGLARIDEWFREH